MTHWLGLRCSPSVALGPCGCGASDTEHSEQVPASAAAVELLHENTYFEVSLAPSGPKAAVERATAAVHVPFRDSSGAQLTASNGKPLRGTCGVTFISPKHAGTAAHCVEDPSVTTSLTSPVVQVMPEAGGSSPWCATHNGVLYTSQNAGGTVRRYRIQGTSLVRIADLVLKNHEYESPVSLTAIAGGAISDSGETLFLTSDSLSLIAAFDLPTGGLRTLVLIPPIQGWPVPNTVEIEGITYWNDPPSPGIDGQLHVVTLLIQDVPPDEDNFAFRHFAVANPADLGRL